MLPTIARVRQTCRVPALADVAGVARRLVESSRIRERVPAGGSVAVGVGSRGVHDIAVVARATVDALKALGYRPFVVAAMGSHGGATPEGQREVLDGYGVTAEAMGCEIRTDMETVEVGTSPTSGLPIHFDRNALGADGLVLINRIKPHTDFTGPIESGVVKMLVIGLGKHKGAAQVHKLGARGLGETLPAVGRILVEKTPFALGLGIVENADDRTAEIHALEPETLLDDEPTLLARARILMARLPFEQIDVLIVGEVGKNYSGAGLDPNVIGRRLVETQDDFETPRITRLGILDASPESHGNLVGIGFGDLTTKAAVAKLDAAAMRINSLTAGSLERARIPITLPTDAEVFRIACQTCWKLRTEEIRLVIIPNTLELGTLWISPALRDEALAHADLTLDDAFGPIPFGEDGTLPQIDLFPESLRARR